MAKLFYNQQNRCISTIWKFGQLYCYLLFYYFIMSRQGQLGLLPFNSNRSFSISRGSCFYNQYLYFRVVQLKSLIVKVEKLQLLCTQSVKPHNLLSLKLLGALVRSKPPVVVCFSSPLQLGLVQVQPPLKFGLVQSPKGTQAKVITGPELTLKFQPFSLKNIKKLWAKDCLSDRK